MREILFRGKRMDNGEWVESGSITRVSDDGVNWDYYFGAGEPATYVLDEHGNMLAAITKAECVFYRVDPNTVGQFTGLYDGTKWADLTDAEKLDFYHQHYIGEDGMSVRFQNVDDVKFLWKGKKIFEGDIFKFPDEVWEGYYTSCGIEYNSWETENYGVVGFSEYYGRYDFVQYKYSNNTVDADIHENNNLEFVDFISDLEVIGNIHDNPELLKGGADNG